jgi:hypothetical protein
MIPILGTYLEILRGMGQVAGGAGIEAQGLADLARLQAEYVVKTLGAKKKLTAEEIKALKAARLKLAIDKANIALGKGQEVFDMDKIQNAAALQNQAELLAKSTTDTQRLQIANDTARLNIKKSISDLEDAIASKDEAAITAATKRLNEDLKIFSALTAQNVKLADIKSILDTLKPKDLINLTNLDAALAKIQEMLRLLAQANAQGTAKVPTSGSLGSGIPVGDYIKPISKEVAAQGSIGAILEYADAATERANAFALLQEQQNYADMLALIEYQKLVGDLGGYSPNMNRGAGYGSGGSININVMAPARNQEQEARDIIDVLRQAGYRGTESLTLL